MEIDKILNDIDSKLKEYNISMNDNESVWHKYIKQSIIQLIEVIKEIKDK